jgi:hypothetical protein
MLDDVPDQRQLESKKMHGVGDRGRKGGGGKRKAWTLSCRARQGRPHDSTGLVQEGNFWGGRRDTRHWRLRALTSPTVFVFPSNGRPPHSHAAASARHPQAQNSGHSSGTATAREYKYLISRHISIEKRLYARGTRGSCCLFEGQSHGIRILL